MRSTRSCSPVIDEYSLLVEAILHQAGKDMRSKSYELRTDAMDFFISEWFEFLTLYQLDGEAIIQQLLNKE